MGRKLIRYDKPKEEGGLYSVYFDYGDGEEVKACMTKSSFDVFIIEEELLKKGRVSRGDLEKYREALRDEFEEEENEGNII